MKRIPFLFLYIGIFIILSSATLYGQMAVGSNPELSGISEERLQRYTRFLEGEIAQGKIAGAVSLVQRNGFEVQKLALGLSDIDTKTPMQEDGIFHIMSMTKPIISVAFMMLYEEGHFFLTDPVSKYLPQFKELKVAVDVKKGKDGATVPANSEITIHQLLTHTAGFSHGLGGTTLDNQIAEALYFKPQESIESRVNTLVNLPLIGQPGAQWYYSASPDVLSLLIEHFTHKTTAQFLKERIFDPLGMVDTGYNIPQDKQNRWVPVHQLDEEEMLISSPDQLPRTGNTVYGGTHGLFSTASDYLKFCQMLLNKGAWQGKQLLSPKTVELMVTNQVGDLYKADGQGFGLGFGITTDLAAGKALGSEGQYYWSGAYCTYFFIDPETKLIAILLTQLQPYSNYYGNKMRQFIYQSFTD